MRTVKHVHIHNRLKGAPPMGNKREAKIIRTTATNEVAAVQTRESVVHVDREKFIVGAWPKEADGQRISALTFALNIVNAPGVIMDGVSIEGLFEHAEKIIDYVNNGIVEVNAPTYRTEPLFDDQTKEV